MENKVIESNIVIITEGILSSIISQKWLIDNDIVNEESIKPESVFSSELVYLVTDKYNFVIIQNQIRFNSKCIDDECSEILYSTAKKLISKLSDIDYKAVGINYKIQKYTSDLNEYTRRMFFKEDVPLFSEFNDNDAYYGSYLSKNFCDGRLKLDIKPVVENDASFINCLFNYHKDSTASKDVISHLDNWKSCLDETIKISKLL